VDFLYSGFTPDSGKNEGKKGEGRLQKEKAKENARTPTSISNPAVRRGKDKGGEEGNYEETLRNRRLVSALPTA